MIIRWLTVVACLFPFLAVAQRSERPGAAPPPVIAHATTVRVGQSVTVPLGIHGVRGRQLEFMVRSGPKLGKLSKIVSTGPDSAVVSFRAGPKSGVDRFTYAVRSDEGVSAPGVVSITITEPEATPPLPARIGVQEKLDFPPVVVGERTTASLEIKNLGGSPAEGEVTVQPPWRIDGSAQYRVQGGESAQVVIALEPASAGKVIGEAVVSRQPFRSVSLSATASAPIEFSPARLDLVAGAGSQTRKGVLKITNHTAEERVVRVSAGKKLITGATLTVAPKGTAELPVFAEPGPADGFEDKLELASDTWSSEVTIRAAAIGAVLRMDRVSVPGEIVAGQPVDVGLIVSNSGSADASVMIRADSPLEVPGRATLVPAGKTVELKVRHPRPGAGAFSGKVTMEGAGQTLSEVVSFAVPDGVAASGPVTLKAGSAPTPPAPRPQETEAPSSPPRPPQSKAMLAAEHPNGRGRRGSATSPTTGVIEWPADFGETEGLSLKHRVVSLDENRAIRETWVPGPPAIFKKVDSKMRAELSKLEPGALHTLRVVDSDGDAVLTVSIATPRKPPFIDIGWRGITLTLLFTTLAIVGWFKWKHRVRSGW